MEIENQKQPLSFTHISQIVMRGIGILFLAAGAYLGYISFEKARITFDNPSVLMNWLELDKKFPQVLEAPNPANVSKQPVKISESDLYMAKTFYEIKGYLILFLSLLYLLILVKIAGSFIKTGMQILMNAVPKEEKETE